jgi:3-deoxy-manno-octulosonate cytidylyltransferase (CMP-KDO synthetase)
MFHIVIPARYGSTRLPGKALLDIAGHPMVWWVWQRALASSAASVVVATDHEDIASVMRECGADVAMTKTSHPSGTDRLAEVVDQRGWGDDAIVVNLQGDEPLMPVENLEQVARELAENPAASIATLAEPITDVQAFHDPSVVKVVASAAGNAMYFSRAPIPYPRDIDDAALEAKILELGLMRHVGLYAYRCGFLRAFVTWEQAPTERVEALEQLRALHHGATIRVAEAAQPVPAGVDTPKDLEHVRGLLSEPRA